MDEMNMNACFQKVRRLLMPVRNTNHCCNPVQGMEKRISHVAFYARLLVLVCSTSLIGEACASEAVWLSSLDLSLAQQTWGKATADKSLSGQSLLINGRRFEHGVATHSVGYIAIDLRERAERFSSFVGVDDDAIGHPGTVIFKVLVDGKEVWSSGTMKPNAPAKKVDVDLKGARALLLVVEDAGDGYEFDHADWCDAQIQMSQGKPIMISPEKVKYLTELKHPKAIWSLKSGNVEYQLRQTSLGVDCAYFGLTGKDGSDELSAFHPEITGKVEGHVLKTEDLLLTGVQASQTNGNDSLRMTFSHQYLPLEISAKYSAWNKSGVISRQITVSNRGTNVLHVNSLPSVGLQFPEGEYELTTLRGGWGEERQVAVDHLRGSGRRFDSSSGRSTSKMSPWFAVRNENNSLYFIGQLAWSGNWTMDFQRVSSSTTTRANDEMRAELGIRFDHKGPALLMPGKSLEMPMAAFTCAGGLDAAANAMHRFQRQFVVPQNAANRPPLVQFNSWYPFPGKMNIADMKRCVDIAADIGTEVFVLDAGWYSMIDWVRETGDWQHDPEEFPGGAC